MHADSLLWKRYILERSDRGHVDVPCLIEGHYALQVSVTKSPAGQNFYANGADTDSITGLVKVQLQPMRTWGSLLQRSLYRAEKLHGFAEASQGKLRLITTPEDIDLLLADRRDRLAFASASG
jgi:membrane dipeptidase